MKIILKSMIFILSIACTTLAHAERNYSIGFGGGPLWIPGSKLTNPSFGRAGSIFLETYARSGFAVRFEASWMKFPDLVSERMVMHPIYLWDPRPAASPVRHEPELIGGSLSFILLDQQADVRHSYIMFSTGAYELSADNYDAIVVVIGPGLGFAFGRAPSIGLEMNICAVINGQGATFVMPLRLIARI